MRLGVVEFPGSSCEDVIYAAGLLGLDAHRVWHRDTDLGGLDALILPGGFSYGDYIRCGAVARLSPVMAEVVRFAERGCPVMGIGNGFQMLAEARLLPGALLPNATATFVCRRQTVRSEPSRCQWLDQPDGTVFDLPVSHGHGYYYCDEATYAELEDGDRIVLRYCERDGSRAPGGSAPNGSPHDVAGICNERGNVFGLMPHPERAVDPLGGSADGRAFFTAVVIALCEE